MNTYLLYYLVIIGFVFTSCVPTKDLIYLQNNNDSNQKEVISQVVAKPYRLQVNDVITITIKAIDPKLVAMFSSTESALTQKTDIGLYFDGYVVDDHGNIRIPILGELNVLGFTLEEVRETIEKKLLQEYFNRAADIFATVKLAGLHYTINGEIASPGTKVLYKETVNILEAIANSGDITITGNRKKVTIIRQFPHGLEMHNIDLTDINALQSPYYFIQPNDYIYIEPLKLKTWGTGTTGIQSLGTIISILSLATTVFLLLKK